jgi:peptidyl-prolyl cis-trans isomerase D
MLDMPDLDRDCGQLAKFLWGRNTMLDLMRKHARNWLMKLILGIIIVVFVFYFGSMSGRNKAERLALIDGRPIVYIQFQNEYQNLLDMYQQKLGRSLTEEMLKGLNLKQQAFDNLINQEVILKKAEDMKIIVSDEDVKKAILAYPAFQRDGVFDKRIYEQTLRASKMTPEEFETSQRRFLLTSHLEGLIQEGVRPSDEEALDFYRMQKEKLNLSYIQVSPAGFIAGLKPSQTEFESFLKANEGKFRVSEHVQVKYLFFNPHDYAASVAPSESEIQEYYERHGDIYKKKDKVVSLADAHDKISAEIKVIAGRRIAMEEAKNAHDAIYQQENFDAYAAQKKLAVQTTGFFPISTPPQEFRSINEFGKALSRLQNNDVSRVLQAENGYYILKIAARNAPYVPAFKDIAADVEKQYREAEAKKVAQKEAEKLLAALKKGEGLAAVAKQSGLSVNETGFFLPGGEIPKLGSSAELTEALVQLSTQKPYPDKIYFINGVYAVVVLKERSKAEEGDFTAQKDAIVQYLSQSQKTEVFKAWLAGSKAELIKKGRLEIMSDSKDL